MKPTLITALLIVISTLCAAQTDTQVRSWQNLYEQLSDIDDMESGSLDDMYERLCELEDSPIDLNNATDDDLQQLTFLSEQQREDLTAYLYYYRPLRSMGEIAMIESMDPLRIQLLRHFTFIGSNDTEKQVFSLEKALKYGKNELVATTKIPFYERKGDRNGTSATNTSTGSATSSVTASSCKPASLVRRMPANLSSATVTNSVMTIIPIIFLSENWGASRLWLSVNTN